MRSMPPKRNDIAPKRRTSLVIGCFRHFFERGCVSGKRMIPHGGRSLVIDDFESPCCFIFKAIDFHTKIQPFNFDRRESPEETILGSTTVTLLSSQLLPEIAADRETYQNMLRGQNSPYIDYDHHYRFWSGGGHNYKLRNIDHDSALIVTPWPLLSADSKVTSHHHAA